MMNPSRIIVALDFPDEKSTLRFVEEQLSPELCCLKIGKELFTATGRHLVEKLIAQNYKVFLDLKYHDIPNTVASACRVAADMGVFMIDMHCMGGHRMMEAAANALAHYAYRPLLIGVTVLTSMEENDLSAIGMTGNLKDTVIRLAQMAQQSGLDGTVSSAQEASLLREQLGKQWVLVTPGIRLQQTQDDQRRVMTPQDAIRAGSHYLVIGRPITQSSHPMQILRQVYDDIQNVL
ncbi:MAG: orotidine-5'-phosphate decarboxylase [Neisseriaceae bacterium]|nr:orotidine-5'-phosphate decarboxylase [Neisseriaceae bacterium]